MKVSGIFTVFLLASCSNTADQLYQQAIVQFDQKDYSGAIQTLNTAINLDNKNGEAYFTRGSCYFNLDDFEKAVIDYNAAIALSRSKDAEAYFLRGNAQYHLNQLEAAIHDITMAITIDPNHAEAFQQRAYTWIAMGNSDSALHDFGRSLEIDPALGGSHFGLGNYFANLPDYDLAIAHYSQAIDLGAKSEYYFNRGLIYALQNNFSDAIHDFSNAIDINSQYAEAYVMRGNMRDESGHPTEALADFDQAIKINPANGAAYFNRGITRKNNGDLAGACADFNKALDLGYQEAIAKTGDCPN